LWRSRAISASLLGLLIVLSGCVTTSSNLIDSGTVKLEAQNSKSVHFQNVRVYKDDDGFRVIGHIRGHGGKTGLRPRGSIGIEVLDSTGQVIEKKNVKLMRRDRHNHGAEFGEYSSHVHIANPEGATIRLSHINPSMH
jgi:hypothetical protein